jgi:hypothetical protein
MTPQTSRRAESTVHWPEFASSNPELAAFGAARLTGAPAYLATVRADGAPRVHPITPVVAPSGLYVFMEPTSPKAADLRDRGPFALHNGVRDNAGSGGEFSVRGQARPVDDAAIRTEACDAARYDPADRYILFELLVGEARANGYGDVELPPAPRWKA